MTTEGNAKVHAKVTLIAGVGGPRSLHVAWRGSMFQGALFARGYGKWVAMPSPQHYPAPPIPE